MILWLESWNCKPSNDTKTIYALNIKSYVDYSVTKSIKYSVCLIDSVKLVACDVTWLVYIMKSKWKLVLDCAITTVFKDYYLSITCIKLSQYNFGWTVEQRVRYDVYSSQIT